MAGRITTHALDLSIGKPASGLSAELWFACPEGGSDMEWRSLAAVRLNPDGRADAPLAKGELERGVYELRFAVGEYFGDLGAGFLDVVPVRFLVADSQGHYHIPLLVSPGGYSTYRGS